VRSALTKVPGVVKVEVTMPDSAVVTIDKKKVTSAKLIEAVKKAGYGASVKKDKKETKS
jgi:copper chaperone CopZ